MKIKIFLAILILLCIIGLAPLTLQLMGGDIPSDFAPGVKSVSSVKELARVYSSMLWLIIALGITCLLTLMKDVLDEIQDSRQKY